MKKSELLKLIDQDLLDRLFGFCYTRTSGSQEAEELCSDIVFELVKTANSEGEIGTETDSDTAVLYAFIWRVARNVYADFAEKRRRETDRAATGDTDALFALLSDEDDTEEREAMERDNETLRRIYRQIANLTYAYRTVMIAYYLDGMPIRKIAYMLGTSENTIRQRLFSARETLRKEVTTMEHTTQKPVALRHLNLNLWGSGNPLTGDPRSLIERQFSRHIAWLCRHREVTAREIAEELNVPMIYVEEELELQTRGTGKTHYGTLRKLANGRYTANVALLSKEEVNQGREPYAARFPALCDIIVDFIEKHKQDYLSFPYLNHRVEWNLVLWHHVRVLSDKLGDMVAKRLRETYFADVTPSDRPFTIYGYEKLDTPDSFCGWDGIRGKNLCGYREIGLENLYTPSLKAHFHCGHDIADDEKIHLAIRAIEGLPVADLTEEEREQAAKAIECGYLYREGDTLYTKILVSDLDDAKTVYLIDSEINESIRPLAEQIAEGTAKWIRATLPEHLLSDYLMISSLASAGSSDAVFTALIDRGILTLPEGGIGAEGCWMKVKK